MTVTSLATIMWAAGFLSNAALAAVLLGKKRYRILPWFTAFITAGCAYSIVLFLGYRLGSRQTYDLLYSACDAADLLLQISVVFEIARLVLRRSGRWVEGARLRLTFMGVTAPLVAAIMAFAMKPVAASRVVAFFDRASLFTTILVFLLFVAVVAASHQLGLTWRSYPVRVSTGMVAWVSSGFFSETLQAYWPTLGHIALLSNIHMVVFQAVTLWWCFAFWTPERRQVPLSDAAKIRLQNLQKGLEYGQR